LLLFVTLLSHPFFGPAIVCLLLFLSLIQNILDKSSKVSCYKRLSVNFVLVFSEVHIFSEWENISLLLQVAQEWTKQIVFFSSHMP
jgi:hypothetical protein